MTAPRGFTVVELGACLVLVAVMAVLAAPVAGQGQRDPGLAVSLNKVHQIMAACASYELDTGRVPMRGSRYNNGNLSGWDGWNFGGKNCRQLWQSYYNGIFDESAYSRPLNVYLYPDIAVPKPLNYVNIGAGATWTLHPGTPSSADRAALQLDVYRSPGDIETYNTSWPNPMPGLSSYDDIGTSYLLNMKWWEHPSLAGTFTHKYNTGTNLISVMAPPNYVWVGDQALNVVPFVQNAQVPGEFGGTNMSVVGFMDGRSEYIQLLPGAMTGSNYTLWPGGRAITRPGNNNEANRR